jgi:hypothetical protein
MQSWEWQKKSWEDHWFGSLNLAAQFFNLCIIMNENIVDIWDGATLKGCLPQMF